MSFYESNYYQNPGPAYGPGGDIGMPMPGWGELPNMAGPQRVGVGGVALSGPPRPGSLPDRGEVESSRTASSSASSIAWPMVALAAVGGVVAGVARNSGWI